MFSKMSILCIPLPAPAFSYFNCTPLILERDEPGAAPAEGRVAPEDLLTVQGGVPDQQGCKILPRSVST